jgi:hypothetical protein
MKCGGENIRQFCGALDVPMPDLSVIGPSDQQKLRHFPGRMILIGLSLNPFAKVARFS